MARFGSVPTCRFWQELLKHTHALAHMLAACAAWGGGRDWRAGVGRERVAKPGCISYARPSTVSGMLATARGLAGGPDGGWRAPTLSY